MTVCKVAIVGSDKAGTALMVKIVRIAGSLEAAGMVPS
jgi:acetaldehyde dehydrogenase (acetylating)